MRTIAESLKSIFESCKGIMSKVLYSALGGSSLALKVLATVLGLIVTIGVTIGAGLALVPVGIIDSLSDVTKDLANKIPNNELPN